MLTGTQDFSGKVVREEHRFYPTACTSAYCGRGSCPLDCPNLPALQEFKRWKRETNAKKEDPVWSPLYYVGIRILEEKEDTPEESSSVSVAEIEDTKAVEPALPLFSG